MKKLIALILFVQLTAAAIAAPWTGSIATGFSGGDGSLATPYLIGTADELAYLAQQTNATASFSTGKYFQLNADIDLGNVAWTPIGKNTTNYKFAGVFDGNYHLISNIYYNATVTTTNSYVGLFGYIAGATAGSAVVKNITLTGSIIAANFVGGFAGRADNVTFTNCKNAASVKASTNSSGTPVGGIAGRVGGGSTLTYCSNSGTIEGVNDYAGGIAGNAASGTTAAPTIIQYCYNSGSVSGSTKYVGGITGYGGGGITIDQCFNSGKISATQGASGGIDGYGGDGTHKVIITNCYNTGAVSGATSQTGGIVGFTNIGKWFYNITNCYNTGTVTNTTTSEAIAGQIVAGAPAGFGVVSNCYFLAGSAATNANGGTSQTSTELQGGVSALNSGSSLWSADATNLNGGYPILTWQTTYAVLTAPTVSSPSSITATGVTANWTVVTNAIGYIIKVYDATSALKFTFFANGQSTTSIALTGLVTNTYYTYKVTAVGNSTTFESPESASSLGIIPGAPVLAATTATASTTTSVTINGNVTADGGVSPISVRGICWSILPNPTTISLDSTIADASSGLGLFTSEILNLIPNTTYYVRAFATNTTRTTYGTQTSIKILSTPVVSDATALNTTGFTANWTAVTSASSYDVNVYQGASLIKTVNTSGQATASLAITDLTSETAYTFTVVAKGNGTSIFNSAESLASNSITTSTSTALHSANAKTAISVIGKTIILPEKGTVQVFNLQGAEVLQYKAVSKLITDLKPAIYFVRFTNNKGKQTIQKISII